MNNGGYPGRVGADAELRTTQSGQKVLNFRIANTIGMGERRKDQWIDCQYWGRGGEAISDYIKKGDKITVFGEISLEEFQRRDGSPGSKLSLNVTGVELAPKSSREGRHPESGGGDYDRGQSYRDSQGGGSGGGAGRGGGKPAFDQDLEDEIPF